MEVIVVNDRSTDRSVEIIKGFPVRLINKLSSSARNPYSETVNKGIKHARGDYVAIIDADIEVESDWLVRLLSHFRNEDVGTVSGFILVPLGGSWVNTLYYLMARRTYSRLLKRNGVTTEDIFPRSGFYIFPREVFEKVGFFDESIYATDIMFDLELRVHGYRQICDLSTLAHDIRGYTTTKLVKTSMRNGVAMYQTGGSVLYMHEQLLFRYVVLSPHYCLTLFRYGRSLVSLLFPVYALMKYFSTVIGYLSAVLSKEQKCPEYLRQKRKENEIKWMLNSFRKEIRKIIR